MNPTYWKDLFARADVHWATLKDDIWHVRLMMNCGDKHVICGAGGEHNHETDAPVILDPWTRCYAGEPDTRVMCAECLFVINQLSLPMLKADQQQEVVEYLNDIHERARLFNRVRMSVN